MSDLLLPMAAHVLLCVLLYGLLTLARAPKVWGMGKTIDSTGHLSAIEPRVSANLKNQFEWPLFFHLICLLLIATQKSIAPIYISLAWGFLFGRLVHSGVQILTTNVRLRGLVFTINFVAVSAMWVTAVVSL